jgi:hypothetical protein
LRDGLAQLIGSNAQSISCYLNEGFIGRPVIAEHDRKPGHALTADEPNFELLVSIGRDNRGKAIFNEIAVLDGFVRHFENMPKWELHGLKIGFEQRHIGG